jgi:chemotaxis protein histidine kinase CheA
LEGASVQDQASLHSGRGVGLAAVRQAVEGWGGELSVTTKAGQGTAFCLTVPLES